MPRAVSSAPSPRDGAGKPVAALAGTATGPYTAAIAALRIDLETHRQRAVEIEALITKLVAYTANSLEPPPPIQADKHAAPSKRRGGRPPIDPADAQRAKKAANMRARRARLKAAAAAPPKAKPSTKRPPRQHKAVADKAVAEVLPAGDTKEPPAEAAPPASSSTNGAVKVTAGRERYFINQPRITLTEWTEDEQGNRTRILQADGEVQHLKGETF